MARDRKPGSSISSAEVKAGVFLAFCLALFVAMLFGLGRFGRSLRGRQDLHVLFANASALRREAPVRYNGMELGHVRELKILRVDENLLGRLPAFLRRDLPNLPLTDEEREALRVLPEERDETSDLTVDREARRLILDRTMVLLTLDVLSENDTRRFRTDDEYRISSGMLGDSAVEIRTGCARAVAPSSDKVILGISGDIYTDLGKSIAQVKDILGSMAEIVGGETNREALRGQLHRFTDYTERIEGVAGNMQERLPERWDGIDERLDDFGKTAGELAEKVAKTEPQVKEGLEKAQKTIADSRQEFTKSASELLDKVRSYRKSANESLQEWRKLAAEYRESVPERVRSAREWAGKLAPAVDRLDAALSNADQQLNKGVATTKAMLGGYIVTAANFEETTYRLGHWPWSFAKKPGAGEEDVALGRDGQWRKELAQRHYQELRAELGRLYEELANAPQVDKARTARIQELLRESDRQLQAQSPEPPRGKKGRN